MTYCKISQDYKLQWEMNVILIVGEAQTEAGGSLATNVQADSTLTLINDERQNS